MLHYATVLKGAKMIPEKPCRYCVPPKRHAYCQGECEELKRWEQENKDELDRIKFNKRNDKEINGYFIRLSNKLKKMKK